MNILVTGGSGFIGRALCQRLAGHGHGLIVLSRRPSQVASSLPQATRVIASIDEIGDTETIDGIINLAGENLFSKRWSAARKQALMNSRLDTTRALVMLARRLKRAPAVMVSGSAVGFYGNAGAAELTEHSPATRKDFGYRLCDAWEQSAREVSRLGLRLCLIRTGIVLGRDGGVLGRLQPLYRFGLGARLGDGNQWLSWVHHDDMVALLARAVETPGVEGIFNATAPNPVTQRHFHQALAASTHRPAFWAVPAPLLRLALGEMSELLLGGQRVYPRRLEEQGFVFRFPKLEDALDDLAGPSSDR